MQAKVCILTTVHPPFDTRIFHKQAKTLVKAGYDVTLIVQHDKNEVVNGVKISALPKPRNRFTRIFGLTWRAFRLALRQHADVYHFHDPDLLPVGIFLKLFTNAKVIYDVHEDYPKMIRVKYWIPKPLRPLAALLFARIEVRGAHALDAIVTVNEVIGGRFGRNKVVLIKNYPLLALSEAILRPKAAKVSNSLEGTKLIYVGGLTRARGIKEIVEAMEILDEPSNVRLDLIGKFTEPLFKEEVCKLSGFRKTRLVGWVPHPEVWEHLQEADIALMCLHPVGDYTYGLPVKLFEYMAAGLPIIASDFPLWENFFKDHGCGLTVNPLNAKEIAQAIEYLLDHPEVRQKMSENGCRAVVEKYNWESEGEKVLELYEELLRK